MNEHGPTPWRTSEHQLGVYDADGKQVADVRTGYSYQFQAANARHIVRAANSHDELLNVAHMIADYCFMEVGAWKEGDPIGAVYRAAVDAIANAQPKDRSES